MSVTVSSGSTFVVSSGMSPKDKGDIVQAGGTEIVIGGGVASTTTIDGTSALAGIQFISSGGEAINAVVSSGGEQFISAGGSALGTSVRAGGVQIVSGGLISGTTVFNSGQATVEAGGSASSTIVRNGGLLTVQGGGVGNGVALSGGSAEIQSGGVLGASGLTFASGGGGSVLTIDPGAIISGGVSAASGSTGNTLELGSGSGGVIGLGSSITGFDTLKIDGGGAWELTGTTTIDGTLNIHGTLTESSGDNLTVSGSITGGGTIVLDPGAIFSGGLSATSGTAYTLELASGSTSGVISGLDSQIAGFDTLKIDNGAAWELAGTTTLDPSITVNNRGTLTESGGDNLTISGSVTGGGTIVLDPATVTLDGFVGSGQTIRFDGPNDVLNLGDPSQFAGTLASFGGHNTIDLTGVALGNVTSLGFNSSTDVLAVYTSGGTYDLQFQGNLSGHYFHDTTDGSAGIFLTQDTTPCYCPGSLILTPRGEVAVEQLAIGDWVTTHNGEAEPIKWIGRRSYAGRFLEGKPHILPVCIKANALADGVPKRDLWVSPLHAFYLDGCLIPAGELINGLSITQEPVDRVDYIHIELASHALVWAEGAASETFVDDNSRMLFENAEEYDRLYPDERRQAATFCAERLSGGLEAEAIRWRLADRAATLLPTSDTKAA